MSNNTFQGQQYLRYGNNYNYLDNNRSQFLDVEPCHERTLPIDHRYTELSEPY
ncbi:predicted protein [Botrytis cinerea T4]|uniref:Uncharacterized protein n=1 Tax=Botryotinia fuckeliana (strain T4) TaxID=999810 RepID=G2YMY5_BOTF4|nr:predicted protein [Botrytis cinerea T4]